LRVKHRTVIFTAFIMILLAFGGAAFIYFRSAGFQKSVRAALTARIQQATGLRVTMAHFSLDMLRSRFSVSGLELNSPKGLSLTVAEASGSFRLAALWRPKIELGELSLVRLHMTIVPQPGGGPWNMGPVIRRSLALAARKAVVTDSWVEYNNRRIPLDLVLEALECDIQYRPDPQRYIALVSYRNSPLLWQGRKFVYDLDAHLEVLPTGLEIVEFKLREDKSHFTGSGSLKPWDSPTLQVRAVGDLAGEDAVLLTPALADARGAVNVITDIFVNGRTYHLVGRFQGEAVSYRTTVAHSMTGQFDIANDLLQLRNVNGRVGEGTFQLEGDIQLKPSNKPPNHIKLAAQDVMIRDGSGLLEHCGCGRCA
jgi:hypothetical protein